MPALGEDTRTTRSVVVGLAALGAAWTVAGGLHRYKLAGLAVDREAAQGWLDGAGLYAYRSPSTHLGTAEPPVAVLMLSPSAALPLTLTGWLLGLAGVASLLLALIALAGPVARRHGKPRWPVVLLAAGLALLTEPVRATIGYGRLDLLLFGLLTADLVALRRSGWARAYWPGPVADRARTVPEALDDGRARRRVRSIAARLRRAWATGGWAGIGTGVATVLAISPILFIAYLALTRQWRAACTAVVTAATLLATATLLAPGASADWFGGALLEVDRSGPIGMPVNQSLAGVLARLYDSDSIPVLIWLSFAALLVAVGLIRARSAHAGGDEVTAFTLIGLTSAAIGPVSHLNELIWLLPAILIIADTAARRRTRAWPAGVAALLIYALVAADPIWTIRWNGYAFALILLITVLPWRSCAMRYDLGRRPRPPSRIPAIPGPRGR